MSLSLIIAIILIFIILIMLPLIISKKAEGDSKTLDEWGKIKEYGKEINEKTRNKKKIMKLFSIYFLIINVLFSVNVMAEKPYHHLADGTFRNPEGSPKRDSNIKWSYKIFNEERKKIKINFPKEHVVPSNKVIKNLNENLNNDYIAWIGHATFLIKLGNNTIITDPLFSKNTGPLIFGPKRYVDPAIKLEEIPKTDILLLTHNHYDHLDANAVRNFPYKNAKVITPLKLAKYFNRFKDVNELDWYQKIKINEELQITLLPAVHWSKRSLFDTNKTLWGNYLIEYKDKKILFACDTGVGDIYKDLGNRYGPIDITFINIGAYNFFPIMPEKDKSTYHTNPEQALSIARDLKSKKVIGMHWGTIILSLEPIMEPPERFKKNSERFGYKRNDAIIFKIGQVTKLSEILD